MKNILLTLLLFILFSCKSTGDKTDCEVLHVDLVERPVPTEELFSKISVIPLETNDSSFLVRPVKVIIKDNRYYIVDEGVPAVFSFDEEGHLLHKIGKKGQGPGEYREIYDAVIKEKENVLAVQVHKMSTAAFLEDQDFFRFFGIFRNVTLKV